VIPVRISSAVDLYWIPLGADGHVVRWNGKIYEAIKSFIERRPRLALYHTALEVVVRDSRFVIESAPIPKRPGRERGVVATGPVGMAWAGRFRLFRYEIRRWRGGSIPDAREAVGSPVRVATDRACAERVLELVRSVPTPVWGRDELRTGDMWNSNSLTSWLLARAGVDAEEILPPPGGRAPGWDAGLVIARRQIGACDEAYQWNDSQAADAYVRALWWVLALVSPRGSIRYVVLPALRRDDVLTDPTVLDGTAPDQPQAWWRLTNRGAAGKVKASRRRPERRGRPARQCSHVRPTAAGAEQPCVDLRWRCRSMGSALPEALGVALRTHKARQRRVLGPHRPSRSEAR
jgi:hypothetical protein